jgi:serine/threonine-protein kinase
VNSGEAREAPALQAGQRLGEWVLDAPLGRGGFGEVWRARHNALAENVVAVKVPFDRDHASRLRAEGVIQHLVADPRIVRTLGLDPDHDPPYLVVEYVDGESLRERISRGRLEPAEAIRIAREILVALDAAHARGIVHRDLKPENVLLSKTGEVKLADFGFGSIASDLARELLASGSLRTSEGHDIVGTVRYMAPEQRDPRGPIDARVDLYAWGIVLFEMLTGEAPCGAELPSQVVPGLDARLDQIFRRAYARRESRYPSARAALDDLDAVAAKPAHDLERKDPVALQAARSAAPRAGVLARGVALVVDVLPFLWIGLETESVRYALPLLVLYDTAAVALFGRTVGKALMGLKVRASGAEPMTGGRALTRALARILSLATAGVGFLLALGPEKRALHDILAGTLVEHDLGR